MEEGKTTPKKHFTEDSLLSAMERAGADEMPDEVERKGIGTSATRAATIEKLVRIGFVERKGNKKTKYLLPTHKGVALITVMPEQIQSPSMTAEWEQKLLDVEKGEFRDTEFMNEIEGMITELVRTYKIIEDAEVLMHPVLEEIGTCPCCGRHVVERQKGYSCENRQCNFVLWKQNRFFEALGKKMTKPIAVKLLSDGKVALKGCKSKKTGKTYDTIHSSNLYEIWREEKLETFTVDFTKRIPIEVFEKWYENQIMYQKVGKMPMITDLQADFIPLHEAAALLGITKEKMSVITRASRFKDCFEIQVFEDKKWISKKSFQHFLNAQSVYQVVKKPEQVKQDNQESMETKEYISRPEAAALAGVTSGTITKWMQMERFSCVGAGKVLRINRKEFLQWLKEYQEGAG